MKKSPAHSRSSANSRATGKTVDDYLAAVPEPARTTLNNVRATIRSVAPKDAEEVISYGIPAFKHKKVLVWYAAFADHCSLFPTASVIARFKGISTLIAFPKGQFSSRSISRSPLPC